MPAGRPSSERRLDVWMNGEHVGVWSLTPRGQEFHYAESWFSSPRCRPMSLSLPLVQGTASFRGALVTAFFENLLPDSERIRKRLARRFRARSADAFDLLAEIGRDCVGAVQLMPAGRAPPDVHRIDALPLDEAAIERALLQTVDGPGFGAEEGEELRLSLAGAQEKTALLWHEGRWHRPLGATPTTHILKLPLGEVGTRRADFSTSVDNEWLCSRILAAYGMRVARSEIAQFGSQKCLVVERFDRELIEQRWWARLPQEDFCQVTGTPPDNKYETLGGPGIARILDELRASDRAEEDRRTFLKAQLLFWMLAAPDGHAKNFSVFIRPQGHFVLTPLYDVLSAWPLIGSGPQEFAWQKMKLAMAIRSTKAHYLLKDIRRHHWNTLARRHGLGPDFEEVIESVIRQTPAVVAQLQRELPAGFPANIAERICEGLGRSADILARMSSEPAPAR